MKREILVFMASPNDLSEERELFRDTINKLNAGFGDGADIEFKALGWEDTLATVGPRPQCVINQDIDRCDVFILAMYKRWGQNAPDTQFSSYTEEEFFKAFQLWKKQGTPTIFAFFKSVEAELEADVDSQRRKVIDFQKQLKESNRVIYRTFTDKASFAEEIDLHLRKYAKGELPQLGELDESMVLPSEFYEKVESVKKDLDQEREKVEIANDIAETRQLKIVSLQLKAAEDAALLSREGKIKFARSKFVALVRETEDIRILDLAHEFFFRTGDIQSAKSVLEKWLNLSGSKEVSTTTADAYGNLGNVYGALHQFDSAVKMYRKSLTINKMRRRSMEIAKDYGNIGALYLNQDQGKLNLAEWYLLKARVKNEAIDCKEGMARDYSNLGILYMIRGKLDAAKRAHLKSLAIEESLPNSNEGMASSYGSLGDLYSKLGDLDSAEEYYQKSLAINSDIGRAREMTIDYRNLSILYKERGDHDRANEMESASRKLSILFD